ncbi:MAG: hypothetical protein IPJ88_02295 [Myxococcales bacterium]|nr:MAG: hypothetical protein IPJ88_02295 [Myxococcales bacterium]
MPAQQQSLPFYTKTAETEKLISYPSVMEQVIEKNLNKLFDQPVFVHITDNRRLMISSQHRGGHLHVRLHHMFLNADAIVLRALGTYLRRRTRKSASIIDDFIASHRHLIRQNERNCELRSTGAVYDLSAIFDELNSECFEKKACAGITWGQFARSKPRLWRQGSIHLGSYCAEDKLIRIHPVLDQNWVPRFYLRYVVFHEMLHHMMPAKHINGRAMHHSRDFRERERAFTDYSKALAWEERHISALLAHSVRRRRA